MGRLYSSVFYARRDTRTPLRFAVIRVVLTIVLGYLFAIQLPRLTGIDDRWGATGLTASAGIAAWVEFTMLRRAAETRIGRVDFSPRLLVPIYASAIVAAAAAWGVKLYLVAALPRLVGNIATVLAYCAVYLALTRALRVAEAVALLDRVARRAAR
jgi:putative peptidoglycan lipid II flippase